MPVPSGNRVLRFALGKFRRGAQARPFDTLRSASALPLVAGQALLSVIE
jgi:hypothetical protein